MKNIVVVGSQWGDEGKGKIVDWLSEQADVVIIAKMVSISGKDRFKGKNILDVSVNEALRKPSLIMDKEELLIKKQFDDQFFNKY